jgi:hypothetical protein
MKEQQKWTEWIRNVPKWVKGVIGLIAAIVTFVLFFRKNFHLVTTISGTLFLGILLYLCLYWAFARTRPLVAGGKGVFRFENHRPWAFVGIGFIVGVSSAILAFEPGRSFIATAFVGTATPTPTPSPTSIATSTSMPCPYARIVEPEYCDGQTVPTDVSVVAECRNIPQDRYIWVVVRVPKVKPTWLVYPQLHRGDKPTQVIGDGTYETTVKLGGDEDSGNLFNIVILLLNGEANRSFTDYAENCIAEETLCVGIPLPETGVEILDFVTVIRE